MPTLRNSLALAVSIFILSANTLDAQFISFSGQTGGVSPWDVDCQGCPNDLSIDFSTTMSGDNLKWNRQGATFTDSEFVSKFGDQTFLLSFNRPDPVNTGGETVANIQFSRPLPANSKMVIFDVDAIGERFMFDGNMDFSNPQWMESKTAADGFDYPSEFATFDATAQSLSAGNGRNNNFEAYVFDAMGLSSLAVNYATSSGQASLAFVVPVPEPATAALFLSTLLVCFLGRRQLTSK